MRPGRRRYFGHPRLISYLENLAVQVSSATGTTLLFGDLGMPRGGPTLSAHASHQTGLDADVWYARLSSGTAITSDQRESLQSKSVVDGEFGVVNGRWEGAEAQVLRLAASSPEVDRIFVNPSIKKMLCANNRGAEWLSRLRPWWQHDDHFHVRLKCGSTDPLCVNRADPIPPGDGCDATLDSWFDPQMRAKERRMREYPSPSSMPTLPPQCADVLREPAPPAR
jgi:penicillin-insensitive murein endopeptidase